MVSNRFSTPPWKPPRCWMRSKRACNGSQKRGPVSRLCAQKLARLQAIVAARVAWADQLAQIKRIHGWLLEVAHILATNQRSPAERKTTATGGMDLNPSRQRM